MWEYDLTMRLTVTTTEKPVELRFAYALKQGDMLMRQGNSPLLIASRPQDDFAMQDMVLTVHTYNFSKMEWNPNTVTMRVNILAQFKVASVDVRKAFALPA